MLRFPLFLLLFVACCGLPLRAQQYNFRNFSVGEGLAQSQVYAMTEDQRGYLWLGTRGGGLSLFDGHSFRSYTESNGLVNNFIRCMTETKSGNLWIGTDEGLCIFDGTTFKALQVPENKAVLINTIFEDNKGRIWVGTDELGVYVYENGKFTQHFYAGEGLPDNTVNSVVQDKNENIWIATDGGCVRLQLGDKKVTAQKTFTRTNGLPANNVRSLAVDARGRVWFGTYGNGIAAWDGSKMGSYYNVNNGLTTNTLHALYADKKGRIWAASPFGVCRIDKNEVKAFTEHEGLCSNVVMCLLEDSWGNMWFGSSGGGISRLDGTRFLHYNEKSGDMGNWVYAVIEDDQGDLWFGTSNGGVTRYDGTNYFNYRENQGFTAAKVRNIFQDAAGTYWFGTVSEGAWSYDGERFRQYTRKNGLSSNFVNAIVDDPSGLVWMGTAGGGIAVWDKETEKFTTVGKKQGLNAERILALCVDKNGDVWAGSVGNGAYKLHRDTSGKIQVTGHYGPGNGLSGSTVRCISRDANGNLFFGMAGGGVVRYDGKRFLVLGTAQGLASENIYSVITDRKGQLWVGTEKGVDRLNLTANGKLTAIRHYGKEEGFTGIEVSQNAVCNDKFGHVWFGTIHGATRYDPEADNGDGIAPRLHFTGLRLFFDPIANTPYGKSVDAHHPLPASLELPHDQNHLRFEFAGIQLRNPMSVRYTWKLENFDPGWSPETDETQAVYSNIPPGSYTFHVKARNADGKWSETGTYSFRIIPPFYETWWFRILAVLAFIGITWFVFRLRVRRFKHRNKEQLEKLELEKSKIELEKSFLELEQKALRLQMNPHFIFNALNSIQGFITRNDVSEAKRYLAKFAKLMRMILENSRQALTSINQEAELLHNYLELEQLCHGKRFRFEVTIDDGIEGDITLIPVMLIQPFVENAILHGVRHLESGGLITVRFSAKAGQIICTITDNGIGRAASAELNRLTKDHESAALKITEERLAHLNAENNISNSVTITDLKHEDGTAAGTQVVLVLTPQYDE